MSKYLVITTTLGSIRGMHAKEFVAGETVDLDDDDLAGIGLRDGWLCHVDDLDAAPDPPLQAYTVLLPDDMPTPDSGWEVDRPKEGDIVTLSEEEAAPLVEAGTIAPVEAPKAETKPKAKAKPKAKPKANSEGSSNGDSQTE